MLSHAMFSQFALAWSAYLVATASPGPGVMAIVGTAIRSGRSAGVALALGVLTGSMTWALLTSLGISAIVSAHPGAMSLIKLAGGGYLLWLAFGALRRVLKPRQRFAGGSAVQTALHRHYLKGYGIHLTNPKAVLAWIMLVSLALPQQPSLGQTLVFIGGCLLIGTTVFLSFALVFSIPAVHRAYERLGTPIEGVLAVLFGYAGVMLIRSAL